MAKKIFSLKAECLTKNEQKNGGTVTLVVDMQPGDKGQPTARKIMNYRTTDVAEIAGMKPGKTYTITIEE